MTAAHGKRRVRWPLPAATASAAILLPTRNPPAGRYKILRVGGWGKRAGCATPTPHPRPHVCWGPETKVSFGPRSKRRGRISAQRRFLEEWRAPTCAWAISLAPIRARPAVKATNYAPTKICAVIGWKERSFCSVATKIGVSGVKKQCRKLEFLKEIREMSKKGVPRAEIEPISQKANRPR